MVKKFRKKRFGSWLEKLAVDAIKDNKEFEILESGTKIDGNVTMSWVSALYRCSFDNLLNEMRKGTKHELAF